MSLNERSFEGDVAEACHHFGVVAPLRGFLGGTLTGKYITARPPRSRQNSGRTSSHATGPLAVEATKAYAKLAERGADAPNWPLRARDRGTTRAPSPAPPAQTGGRRPRRSDWRRCPRSSARRSTRSTNRARPRRRSPTKALLAAPWVESRRARDGRETAGGDHRPAACSPPPTDFGGARTEGRWAAGDDVDRTMSANLLDGEAAS